MDKISQIKNKKNLEIQSPNLEGSIWKNEELYIIHPTPIFSSYLMLKLVW